MILDDLEEFEARRQPDVGDRRVIAADEGLVVEKELVARGERLPDLGRGLPRLLFVRWRSVAGADFARVLREARAPSTRGLAARFPRRSPRNARLRRPRAPDNRLHHPLCRLSDLAQRQ